MTSDTSSAAAGKGRGGPNWPAVEGFLASALGASSVDLDVKPLSGGAIQENWLLNATVAGGPWAGSRRFVLRRDSASVIEASLGRIEEFALLAVAHSAGVTVPEPIAVCRDSSPLGGAFTVMAHVPGTAAGHVLTNDLKWSGDRTALGRRLGMELARIHSVRPPHPDLAFLPPPAEDHATACIAAYRSFLDRQDRPWPALYWGLAWLERNRKPSVPPVLLHRDFRTGNYLVDETGLTAVLDWEFAGWGDPREDIGWFCARCWRFAAPEREGGGVSSREDFYAGYEAESGTVIDRDGIAYWEVMATLRWAVIAIQQANRHLSGGEDSLELALTGRRLAELSWDILAQTAGLDGEAVDRTESPAEDLQPASVEWPSSGAILAPTAALLRGMAARLTGQDRYEALMAANAVAMANRDGALSASVGARIIDALAPFVPGFDQKAGETGIACSVERLERNLQNAIRGGALQIHDVRQGITLRQALGRAASARLAISNPRY